MKLKWLLAFISAALTVFACSREKAAPAAGKTSPQVKRVQRLAVPPAGQAYTGAYVDFGETEDNVTLEGLENFERLVGRHQALISFSNYWGKQSFPSNALKIIYAYGAVALVYWNPWDRPYAEETKPGHFNLPDIVAGKWDSYIDMWAGEAKKFGRPMLVAWGLEMNGTWFPWSGFFYGGGTIIPGTNSSQYQGPELFKKAYRHVVDRVRSAGADNIQWVFHANNTSEPNEPWNRMANYYPGSQYVDWLGLSAFGQQYPNSSWVPFQMVLPDYYKEICSLDPDKPFILAEWGVGEFPTSGNKEQWIAEALQRMAAEFPRLKAAVFWHDRWQNGDLSYSNLRVNSSEGALNAYRQGIAHPFWLDQPVFVE
jgi:hypothetical protein